MKLPSAVLALTCAAAFAQQPAAVVGTIVSVSAGEIRVKAGAHPVAFRVDRNTAIRNGGANHTAVLKTGAEVSVRGVKDASGGLLAHSISARQITFPALVGKLDPANSEILAVPRKGGARLVRYFPNTVFSTSPERLAPGQDIFISGLEWQGGTVDATRIAVYNTDAPADQ